MYKLNYHHLYYFYRVAQNGNLTATAGELHLSQSALSTQIRKLEDDLDQELFRRENRQLVLTEAGKLAVEFATDIFESGEELLSTLAHGRSQEATLRIGAVATLSRNFQDSFIEPLLAESATLLSIASGTIDDLIEQLVDHRLDVVLANQRAPRSSTDRLRSRRLAQQQVALIGDADHGKFRYPKDLGRVPMVLPGPKGIIRRKFDDLCESLGIVPNVVAEVDDMAMMRLLARDMQAVALLPAIVVRDELRAGTLVQLHQVPKLYEDFFAITLKRKYPHPTLQSLLRRSDKEILAMES